MFFLPGHSAARGEKTGSGARRPLGPGAAAVLLFAGLAFLPSPAPARSLPFRPEDRPRTEPAPGVRLEEQAVEAAVRDGVVEVEVRSTFFNPGGRIAEGRSILPLPSGASVNKFSMTAGGKEMEGEILDARKAREAYEAVVRKAKDPGLLESVSRDLFQSRVFPVPPAGRVETRVSFSCAAAGSPAEIRLPFFARGAEPLKSARLALTIEDRRGLKAIYSPTHDVSVERLDARRARVTFTAQDHRSDEGFVLYFDAGAAEIGASLLTYRRGEDGFWALMVSPGAEGPKETLPRDVVFVLDRSGSMAGQKIDQARRALAGAIERLSDGDRFNVVTFATGTEAFSAGLLPATPENRKRALDLVSGITAAGGTNIEGALDAGLRLLPEEKGRLPILLFITDGVPTIGEADLGALTRKAKERNAARARISTFGLGADVNTALLDTLAADHGGERAYVSGSESVEEKVAPLMERMAAPVLAGVRVSFEGVAVSDVTPGGAPDLYRGGQIVFSGRFKGHGKARVVVEGLAGGKTRRIEIEAEFPEKDGGSEALGRMWARRRIGTLLDDIRLRGSASDEIVDEIIALAIAWKIVTPYTSFLILEEGASGPAVLTTGLRNRFRGEIAALRDRALKSGYDRSVSAEAQAESRGLMQMCR